MRRPDRPLHPDLKKVTRNPRTGLYDLNEKGVTYSLTLEQLRALNHYFRSFYPDEYSNTPTLERWYADIDRFTRKSIIRSID